MNLRKASELGCFFLLTFAVAALLMSIGMALMLGYHLTAVLQEISLS
jgi:hypothetical protein